MIKPNKNTERIMTILILNSDLIAVRFSYLKPVNSLKNNENPISNENKPELCCVIFPFNSNVIIFYIIQLLKHFCSVNYFFATTKSELPTGKQKPIFIR